MQDPLNDTGQIELKSTIKMKELTIKHGGWVRSDLFKQIAECITKDNERYATLHNLPDDGMNFKSMKTSLDHVESLTEYFEVEVTNCQEFVLKQKPILPLQFHPAEILAPQVSCINS